MDEEYWTTREGKEIAVGEMEVEHLRNAMRMVLRKRRQTVARLEALESALDATVGDTQDELAAQAYRDLANPRVFFPLLEGGVYGSPDLQCRHGR